MKHACAVAVSICALALFALPPSTYGAVKKHPVHSTAGTNQMAGGYAHFGTTYTVNDDGPLLNITITKAEYTIDPYNVRSGNFHNAEVDHKLMMIHMRIKNPNKNDMYIGSGRWFQAVDSNNNTIGDAGDIRRESEKDTIGTSIKPGQGIDDLETCVVVPAQGAMTKLILQMGLAGTSDRVLRFNLGPGANRVAPLPAPYADPADKSGDSALTEIPATVGTTYTAGACSMSLDAVDLEPGPLGNHVADDGKQYLVATVTLTNLTWGSWYVSSTSVKPTLKTDDDKITYFETLMAKHDDNYSGIGLDGGESRTYRLIMQVPKDASLKSLSLVDDMGDNGQSPTFVYDVSGLKAGG